MILNRFCYFLPKAGAAMETTTKGMNTKEITATNNISNVIFLIPSKQMLVFLFNVSCLLYEAHTVPIVVS